MVNSFAVGMWTIRTGSRHAIRVFVVLISWAMFRKASHGMLPSWSSFYWTIVSYKWILTSKSINAIQNVTIHLLFTTGAVCLIGTTELQNILLIEKPLPFKLGAATLSTHMHTVLHLMQTLVNSHYGGQWT